MKRPPYRAAVLVAAAVLAGYLLTLAPGVTFWDAGEFITAARTLGIPHEPGTPLFVLLANVWGRLVPFGVYAWRINLFSAACTAAAAACWFLVAHDVIARCHPDVDADSSRMLATLGGVSAALLASFSFSTWQSATETEVYAAAMLVVAIVAWIATRWRACRAGPAGDRLLLLALYLGALSVGIHLMALLVGPALIAALAIEARRSPQDDVSLREAEWARLATVASSWVLIVGIGLGDARIAGVGLALTLAAGMHAHRAGQLRFAVLAPVVTAIGVSTLAFLLLRARQHPWLDAGHPDSWRGVLDVLRRTQYPPRTPLDDPTVAHGAGNPGRTVALLGYQVATYAQYFDWQWASSLGDLALKSWPRLAITLLMFTVGLRGALAQWRADRASFGLVATLFAVAGPGLILYLNFKPGPSIGWDRWVHGIDHEVRDRDYFFVASFVAWSIWVAIGLADIARAWIPRLRHSWRPAGAAVFAVAVIPFAGNYRAATRRHTPEATLARDFARALLQSVPDAAVLLTNGDNDTFPLWYVQQVEGLRPDVTVVCLCLAQAPWYVRDLRTVAHVMFDPVDSLWPVALSRDLNVPIGDHAPVRVDAGTTLSPADILVIEVLRAAAGVRPVAWTLGAEDELLGLAPQLVQQGMALVLPVAPVDPATLIGGASAGPRGVALDLPMTRRLIDSVWTFGRLESGGFTRLDPNVQVVARAIAAPLVQVGVALAARGDTAAAVRLLRRAIRLADDSVARETLRRITP